MTTEFQHRRHVLYVLRPGHTWMNSLEINEEVSKLALIHQETLYLILQDLVRKGIVLRKPSGNGPNQLWKLR